MIRPVTVPACLVIGSREMEVNPPDARSRFAIVVFHPSYPAEKGDCFYEHG
jgi:hypothetical protein